MKSTHAKNPIQSVRKAFDIIQVLSADRGIGITEIADQLDEPKSTVHNYLSTLREEGYVFRDGHQYYLGLEFLHLGVSARSRFELFNVGAPMVRRLALETGEFSNMHVEEYGTGVTIFRSEGENAVESNHLGSRTYLNTTAVGKSILAHLPQSRVEEIIETHGLPAATPKTTTDRDELFEKLEEIRERGCAFDDEEVLLGLRCVAAPVLSGEGTLLGAISVSGPTTRLRGDYWREDLAEIVMEASNVIALNIEAR